MFQTPYAASEVEGLDDCKVLSIEEGTMRIITAHVVPLLIAASTSGLLLSVAIV